WRAPRRRPSSDRELKSFLAALAWCENLHTRLVHSAQNQRHQRFKVRNLNRDAKVAVRSTRHCPQAHCVFFSGDQHLSFKLLDVSCGIAIMIPESDAFYGMNSDRLHRIEKPVGLRDTGECHDRMVFESFRRNRSVLCIYALNLSSDDE